jgi:carbamoyl-phosphate synthase large subunit
MSRSKNMIICYNMEDFDPLGMHTGDSIIVAPPQTLPDDKYHMLQSAAPKVIRHLGVVFTQS